MAILNTLAINSGSSSLKASLFLANGERRNYRYKYENYDSNDNFKKALDVLLLDLKETKPDIIGHRFVHGGGISDAARLIDASERARLESISHLAPLHMPDNLLGVDICAAMFNVPQIACFDTAFHATLPEVSYRLPIPKELNIRRYGFHGINYTHVSQQLPKFLGTVAYGRVVIAHLGNGASLCAMENLRSIDTSMGYTPAGGIPMATRSGDIDPGVILELSQRFDNTELSTLVYKKMGLLALSDGESSDISILAESNSKNAVFAVEYFARQVRGIIGSYAAKLGDIDALVFTGGIGEHSAKIRALICQQLEFLGLVLDKKANSLNAVVLNTSSSKPILIIPADEEGEIARLALDLSIASRLHKSENLKNTELITS